MCNICYVMIFKFVVYKFKGNNFGRGRGEFFREREMGIVVGWDFNFMIVILVGLYFKYSVENGVVY